MISAFNDNTIVKNPITGITPAGGIEPKSQLWEKADYDIFMAKPEKILSQRDYYILVLLGMGEHRGELLGLKANSFSVCEADKKNYED